MKTQEKTYAGERYLNLRVQEKQQVKDQQYFILLSVAYPTYPSSNQEHQPRHGNSILCRVV